MPPTNSAKTRSDRRASGTLTCFQVATCHDRRRRRQQLLQGGRRARYTQGGRELERNLERAELEREVAHLKSTVEFLLGLIDVNELKAAQRLAKITPANATLKLWVERSNSYPELAAEPEERPW